MMRLRCRSPNGAADVGSCDGGISAHDVPTLGSDGGGGSVVPCSSDVVWAHWEIFCIGPLGPKSSTSLRDEATKKEGRSRVTLVGIGTAITSWKDGTFVSYLRSASIRRRRRLELPFSMPAPTRTRANTT